MQKDRRRRGEMQARAGYGRPRERPALAEAGTRASPKARRQRMRPTVESWQVVAERRGHNAKRAAAE